MRFELHTQRREQLVDITKRIQQAVTGIGLAEGEVLVYCPHTTAAITITESADPDVASDILAGLSRLVPKDAGWQHSEGNADAHIKAVLVGTSEIVPVSDGRLALGTWQGIFFCEFDGPRRRTVEVLVRGRDS